MVFALIALIAPATGSASFSSAAGGEPPVTNTPTDSHFFNWEAQGNMRFCVNVYRSSTLYERGCVPSASTYYTDGSKGTFSQTENGLADGTLVNVIPLQCQEGTFVCLSCAYDFCHSSTLIDLGQPVLTVYAAGTATYTNNPMVPMHIDYFDAHSHPWFANGGDGAAVFVCARRDRPCTNEDVHSYDPNCSHVNVPRLSSPGEAKSNSFDCTFNLTSEGDGPVYLCATAADQSIPDPNPTAVEPGNPPTHVNQFINPATGEGWTAADANLAENSCGSVILDRTPPTISLQASDTTPATGDLVTFSASGSDGLSGISGPYTWDFGDNTPSKQGANITHTYGTPGTYHVTLSGKFDATYTRDEESSCTFTKDAHWTAALASGAGPARLEIYYRDRQGRPVYRFYGPDGGIPWKAQGSGVATMTCNQPSPGSNGTVSCNFQAERGGSVAVESDPEGSREQMILNWYFGFSSFQYDSPGNGGACAYSGTFPPTLNLGEDSPGLFVSTLNDGSNALEPAGFSTIPTSSLGGGATLTFAGSSSASFGGSLTASWQLSVTLRRR